MKLLRLLLLPFSPLYGLVIILRNIAYDTGIFKSHKFNIPVISIGNLVAGGTGKSPMAECMIRLLKDKYKIAILSRGYGRETTGYLELNINSSAKEGGDEPLQFKHKFPSITVAVCENRVTGIEKLKHEHDLIILDDAYQHRAVQPGLSILLFDYNTINQTQFLLPAGDLREPLSGRKRAALIVVTKTPSVISEEERTNIIRAINPYPHQQIFLSYLEYEDLKSLNNNQQLSLSAINEETEIILLTGIANSGPLIKELKRYTKTIIHHNYPDHHRFSTKNIAKLATAYSASNRSEKLIITTEKDAQRLIEPELNELLKGLPVYYLPVKARIHQPGEGQLNQIIEKYVTEHLQHN